LVGLDLVVALERDAIDDLAAFDDADHDLAADDLGADFRKHARRGEIVDGAVHAGLIGPREVAANGGLIASRGASTTIFEFGAAA